MWGMKVVQWTVRYASKGSDLKDMNARTSSESRARTYRAGSEMIMIILSNLSDKYWLTRPFFTKLCNKTVPITHGGTHVMVNEDIRQSNCSVWVGKWNDQARQWIPPKIVANIWATRPTYNGSLFVSFPAWNVGTRFDCGSMGSSNPNHISQSTEIG